MYTKRGASVYYLLIHVHGPSANAHAMLGKQDLTEVSRNLSPEFMGGARLWLQLQNGVYVIYLSGTDMDVQITLAYAETTAQTLNP